MRRRIEILLDADFQSDEDFEDARILVERAVHKWAEPYWGKHGAQVQANEVPCTSIR